MNVDSWAQLKRWWRTDGLALSGSATLFLGLWISLVQQALSVDSSLTMESFLGGTAASRAHALAVWEGARALPIAVTALAIDLVLFISAYGCFLVQVSRHLEVEFDLDGAPKDLLSLIVSTDQSEDGVVAWIRQALSLGRLLRISTYLLIAFDVVEDVLGLIALLWGAPVDPALGIANGGKKLFLVTSVALFLLLLFVWLFSMGRPQNVSGTEASDFAARLIARSTLRRDIADIVWRSRYSISYIGFFAGVVLVMNQGQDVLVGLTRQYGEHPAAHGAVIIATIAGVWLFAYASYLWPRVLSRVRRSANPAHPPAPSATQTFAKWWPRLLGAAPLMALALLSGHASRAAFAAGLPGSDAAPRLATDDFASTGYLILLCGTVSVVLAATFFGLRVFAGRSSARIVTGYFEVLDTAEAGHEALKGNYRVLGVIPRATIWMIPLSFAAVAALRFWGLADTGAPLALAAIAVALALWSCVLGQLSALALRQAIPWVLIVAAGSGVLGALGLTDNHRVPVYLGEGADLTVLGMSIASLALGIVLLAYAGGVWFLTLRASRLRRTGHLVLLLVAGMLVAAVLYAAGARHSQPGDAAVAKERLSMDDAVGDWLIKLCASDSACARHEDANIDAYVVSAEGGGIRAAYWTALTLAKLVEKGKSNRFAEHTFSISSVSGGSLGVAAFRVCLSRASRGVDSSTVDVKALQDCVDQFGRTDLLTPLVSSWLFEDVLSRFIPTGGCESPGCGFMSRGLWFERALERGLDGGPTSASQLSLRAPLNGILGAPDPAAPFAPHLLMNATTVESGERAIASDIAIGPLTFPNARDQQYELGAALKLSTAAHNSARFPFVNAIGAVQRSDNSKCKYVKDAAPNKALAWLKAALGLKPDCLHLADGGYFDNSGEQSTQDVVRAIRRFLDVPPKAGDDEGRTRDRLWLRSHLRMKGLFLNYGEQTDDERAKCSSQQETKETARATDATSTVTRAPVGRTTEASGRAEYNPRTPTCQGPLTLYSDLLGPAVTAKNVGGTGAGGRLSESRLISVVNDFEDSALRWRDGPAAPASAASASPVTPLELRQGSVLFPLGWYLSKQARDDMLRQADRETDGVLTR